MARTMYDAVNPANLPTGGDLYAGYVDGHYANVPQIRARFPGKRVVTISVVGGTPADVLDVEMGDVRPEHAPAWVTWMRSLGRTPTVYCPQSLWLACVTAFHAQDVMKPNWWIARYDDDPTIPAGAVAKQYRNAVPPGYDMSSVADDWPDLPLSRAVAPMFSPPPSIVAACADSTGRGGYLLTVDGGVYTFGDAPFVGAPHGQPYWQGRTPATIQLSVKPGKVYDVVDTSGETYSYPE